MKQIKSSLTKKIYEVGMYLELKEKYLMRKRVGELTGNETEKSAIYEDNVIMEDFSSLDSKAITDSEFRIIGIDESNGKVIEEISNGADIQELDSLSDGFFIFEEEPITEAEVEKIEAESRPEVTLRFDEPFETDDFTVREVKGIKVENETKKDEPKKIPPKEDSKIQFKKEKLRFGFSQEEE